MFEGKPEVGMQIGDFTTSLNKNCLNMYRFKTWVHVAFKGHYLILGGPVFPGFAKSSSKH